MSEHPIEGLMMTAMNSIQDMVDVNTIIGEPIETSNNIIIIPISKVTFGFAAGGSEFRGETIDEYTRKDKDESIQYRLPFGGGSGAGVNINPVAFLVIQENNIKLLPINYTSAIDKLLDYVPDLIEKTNAIINKSVFEKNEENKEDTKDKVEKFKQEIQETKEREKEKEKERIKPKRNRKTFEVEYEESDDLEDSISYIDKDDE